jgi:hypothetical protein
MDTHCLQNGDGNMAIETESVNGYTINVEYDEGSESPREWDNVAHLLMKRDRYNLPWECDENFDPETYGIAEVAKAVTRRHDAAYTFPIYCYDHGSVAYRAGAHNPFNDPWDSGLVGIAYVTNAAVQEARGWYLSADFNPEEWAKAIVDGELDTYTQWANGSVYGFVVKDPLGGTIESCWGFYDDDEAMSEGKDIAEALPAVKAIVVPA